MKIRAVLPNLLPLVLLCLGCGKTGRDATPGESQPAEAASVAVDAKETSLADETHEALRQIQEGDNETRVRAAERLCHLGTRDSAIIHTLRNLIASGDPQTREMTAYALG